MKPDNNMTQIIDRKRYSVANSTVLAHNEYWDGRNSSRNCRNLWLYKTSKGNYFLVHLSLWESEHDYIEPVDMEYAYEIYESLPCKEAVTSEAFPTIVIKDA
jgi:hypothetical protein